MLRLEVEWIDSGLMIADGWQTKEEIINNPKNKITTVFTVGMLMHEDSESMYIALSSDRTHGHFYNLQVIAKESIRSITVLRARKEIHGKAQSTTIQEVEEGVSDNS